MLSESFVRSPVGSRSRGGHTLDRHDHTLIFGQLSGIDYDRRDGLCTDLFDLDPVGTLAAGNLVQAVVTYDTRFALFQRHLHLVTLDKRKAIVIGIGILTAAVERDTVLGGSRPRGHHLKVLAVEVPAFLVGYDDGLEITVVIRIEGYLRRRKFGDDLGNRDNHSLARGRGSYVAQVDLRTTDALEKFHVVDTVRG